MVDLVVRWVGVVVGIIEGTGEYGWNSGRQANERTDWGWDAPMSPLSSAMGCCGRRAEAAVCVRLILRHLLASPKAWAREAPSCS